MAVDLFLFDRWLDFLVIELSPRQRQIFFSRLGKELAKINAVRIRSNVSPDEKAFAPRRPQTGLRAKKGKTKAMFKRIGKSLRSTATADGLELLFSGNRTSHIAAVHHFGLDEELRPLWGQETSYGGRRRIRYTSRELLGISQSDGELIVLRLFEQISKIPL